jgi:hypothetical protein
MINTNIKGILFGGCSFTWGQGLYFYSNLPNLPFELQNHGFNPKLLSQSMLNVKNSIRYPRLVANFFETFEVVKDDVGVLLGNGGSEDETFEYFDYLFNVEKRYRYSDFSHIILQLSNIWRNDFHFDLDGVNYKTKIHDSNLYNQIKKDFVRGVKFDEYCRINNYTFSDIEELHKKQQLKRLKDKIVFYNQNGIEVKIVTWHIDLFRESLKDSFFNDVFIKLKYEDKIADSIQELMSFSEDMIIESDFKNNKGIRCEDRHPSKECHKIIAKSIIENLKK